jgi:hypothetical protein
MAVDLHPLGFGAGDLAHVEADVVGIDRRHQLELRVAGDGPAHGRAHAATRPEHSDPHRPEA